MNAAIVVNATPSEQYSMLISIFTAWAYGAEKRLWEISHNRVYGKS